MFARFIESLKKGFLAKYVPMADRPNGWAYWFKWHVLATFVIMAIISIGSLIGFPMLMNQIDEAVQQLPNGENLSVTMTNGELSTNLPTPMRFDLGDGVQFDMNNESGETTTSFEVEPGTSTESIMVVIDPSKTAQENREGIDQGIVIGRDGAIILQEKTPFSSREEIISFAEIPDGTFSVADGVAGLNENKVSLITFLTLFIGALVFVIGGISSIIGILILSGIFWIIFQFKKRTMDYGDILWSVQHFWIPAMMIDIFLNFLGLVKFLVIGALFWRNKDFITPDQDMPIIDATTE